MFEIVDSQPQEAVIKVVGVGGCGGNAVDHMIDRGVDGVEFICMNTDAQALKRSRSPNLLQLGTGVTKGLGAGANPDVGRQAAIEDRERIIEMIEGAGHAFDPAAVLAGKLTPVFFGSGVNNFGVQLLLDSFLHFSPSPRGRTAALAA
jgi:cell division protein FtsZ